MKKFLFFICMVSFINSFAQKNISKQKEIDFAEVNGLMTYEKVDTLNYLQLPDAAFGKLYNKYQYNAAVYDKLSALDAKIIKLNLAVSDLRRQGIDKNKFATFDSRLTDLKNVYPALEVSGYLKLKDYCNNQLIHFNDIQDSLRVQSETLAIERLQKKRIVDSIRLVNNKTQYVIPEVDKVSAYYDSLNKVEIEKHRRVVLKKFGQNIGSKINKEEIEIGMTKEMVEYAWGNLYDDSSVTQFKGGTALRVYYKSKGTILTYKNNILVAITF